MIYFAQDSDRLYIKIGYSSNPGDRVSQLQTGNGSRLVLLVEVEGDKATEAELHKRFSHAREIGEWFRPIPELVRHICELSTAKNETHTWRPRLRPFSSVLTQLPCKVYLAGKVEKGASGLGLYDDWRELIVGSGALYDGSPLDETGESYQHGSSVVVDPCLPEVWPVTVGVVNHNSPGRPLKHDYCGPYLSERGSHCGDIVAGEDTHGVAANAYEVEITECFVCDGDVPSCDICAGRGKIRSMRERTIQTHRLCNNSIAGCDVLFAWISELDCFGTIAEIGYAAALGKPILIAGPKYYRDMWFVYHYAIFAMFDRHMSPLYAFSKLLDNLIAHSVRTGSLSSTDL